MRHLVNLLMIASFNLSIAQLSVTTLQGNVPIQDGDIFYYDTNVFEDAKLKYLISNTSTSETINVFVEMVSFTNTDGTDLQLCVQPNCFFSVTPGQSIPNTPVVLGPGENNGPNDYFSNTNPGDGVNYPIEYVLRFYQVDDNGQEIGSDITITYEYTPENFSNDEFDLKDMGISIQNTIVKDYLKLNSNTDAQFKLYDLNSRLIDSYQFNQGQHNFDMSKLNAGNYFLVFVDQAGRKSYARIQKQ